MDFDPKTTSSLFKGLQPRVNRRERGEKVWEEVLERTWKRNRELEERAEMKVDSYYSFSFSFSFFLFIFLSFILLHGSSSTSSILIKRFFFLNVLHAKSNKWSISTTNIFLFEFLHAFYFICCFSSFCHELNFFY